MPNQKEILYTQKVISVLYSTLDLIYIKKLLAIIVYYIKQSDILTIDHLQSNILDISYLNKSNLQFEKPPLFKNPLSFHFKNQDPQYQHQKWCFKQEKIAELSNIALVGEYGVGVTADGYYLKDILTHRHSERTAGAIKRSIQTQPTLMVPGLDSRITGPRRRELLRVEHGCSLYNKWTNYYHWVYEHLLKLRQVEQYEIIMGRKPTLIVPPNPSGYITETLSLMGYENSEWIEWSPPGILVESLLLSTYPQPTPESLSWLRSKMANHANPHSNDNNRIYISREDTNKRFVENEKEVLEMLAAFGFEPYLLEHLTVKEQIRLFSSADAVVAPHGAGLTNILYGNDLTVLELFPEYVYDLYGTISQILGHEYHAFEFKSVNPQLGINSNIHVDVERLHCSLESVLSQ